MNELQTALQLARDDSWDAAHEIVQGRSDAQACLIHAYLHRLEGDLGNARYWYNRAGHSMPNDEPDEEWVRLFEMAGGDPSG